MPAVHKVVILISSVTVIRIIVKKTSQFKTVCKDDSGYIIQLKQQKSKKVILRCSTSPHSQCADKQYQLLIFAVLVV